MLEVTPLDLPGALVIAPKRFGDHRGFFSEVFNARRYAEIGIAETFVQDNHSFSAEKGVIRGLHFQTPPHAQGKLVRVVRDVELSAENWRQLWVPAGFAHGFCTLTTECEVLYKVTDYFAPDNDKGLAFDDPALGIDWPVAADDAILSEKDRQHPVLANLPDYFTY